MPNRSLPCGAGKSQHQPPVWQIAVGVLPASTLVSAGVAPSTTGAASSFPPSGGSLVVSVGADPQPASKSAMLHFIFMMASPLLTAHGFVIAADTQGTRW